MAKRGGGRGRRGGRGGGPREEREDHVKLEGVITNVFAGGQFEVTSEKAGSVRAQLCGKMRKFRIRVILGDHVTVALSPYDLTHGMIVFRGRQ